MHNIAMTGTANKKIAPSVVSHSGVVIAADAFSEKLCATLKWIASGYVSILSFFFLDALFY